MHIYTLDSLMRINRIFFSRDTVKFHEDKKYILEHIDGKQVLRVVSKRTVAHYEVLKNGTLKYVSL